VNLAGLTVIPIERDAHCDHHPALMRLLAGAVDELRHLVIAARGKNGQHAPPSTAVCMKHAPQGVTHHGQGDPGGRQHAEDPRSDVSDVRGERG
jgi:hypothetical protein